jgi:hypothetical protein
MEQLIGASKKADYNGVSCQWRSNAYSLKPSAIKKFQTE